MYVGTSRFAVPSLEALHQAGYRVRLVVTQPDRQAGRGLRLRASPVKTAAENLGIPLFQPERIKAIESEDRIRSVQPDLLVVAAYGQILPANLLAIPRLGCVNVHASLLPRHRGPAPVAWAILSGDEETGVTIMEMETGVDTGPIIAQRRLKIDPAETAVSLEARLAEAGAALLVETLPGIVSGSVERRPQRAEGVTYAPRLGSEDGKIDRSMPAREIDRRVRALTPNPGCWIDLDGQMVKVLRGHVSGEGEATRSIRLPTSDGVYVLDEVQVAGGRPMSAEAYLRGRR